MTIALSENTPRISYAVASGVTQTTFTVNFEFFDDSDLNFYVDGTLKTLATHYTVTGGNGSTGTITTTVGNEVVGIAGGSTVTITRDVELSRVTDFPSSGAFEVAKLNTELDRFTAIASDLNDGINRTIRMPDSDPVLNVELPSATARADKIFKFDTEGNIEAVSANELISNTVIGANYTNNTFTGDGSTVAYTTTVAAGSKNNCQIYIDGVYQEKSTFSISTTTLTFTEAPPLNSSIEVIIGNAINTADSESANVNYNQGGTGAQTRTVESKLQDIVSVKDFGAVGDGVTDDTAAIQAALTASSKIYFPSGSYLFTGIAKAANDIEIDCGNATLINNGGTFLIDLGVTSDTPVYSNVKVYGGHFKQADSTTTNNRNFIRIRGIKDFSIRDCYMENVSNGGIYVEAGTANGVIDGCTVIGSTNYSTIRGIWLIGASASDYASVYMTTSSLARNATAFPLFFVDNVRVSNCRVAVGSYGIYNMNTRDCVFENNHISDIGGARAITINTYSPRAIIKNNVIESSGASSSGILVTQASDGVIIDGNTFKGDYGGGRAIQVQYLAEALITNNNFFCTGSQCIDLNTNATAVIRGNYFKRSFVTNTRAIYALPVDRNIAGTGDIGNTATTVQGFVFEDNIIYGWGAGVLLGTNASATGNEPGWDTVIVRNNIMYEMDNATTSSEYLLRPVNTSTTQTFNVHYYNNTVFPESAASRNRPLVSGDVFFERKDYYSTAFAVTVTSGGGAITVNKAFGANFELSVTRTGTDLLLTPRSPDDAIIAQQVPYIVGIIPNSTDFTQYALLESTNDWTLTLIDSAGTDLDMTSDGASFVVHLASDVS